MNHTDVLPWQLCYMMLPDFLHIVAIAEVQQVGYDGCGLPQRWIRVDESSLVSLESPRFFICPIGICFQVEMSTVEDSDGEDHC